jgi:hypothetical protein
VCSDGSVATYKILKTEVRVLHARIGRHRNGREHQSDKTGEAMAAQVIVNLFQRWYFASRFQGRSSDSGRRTFTAKLAKNVSRVGHSLRGVQIMARHPSP